MASGMIRRGQIHFASLDPVRGREQAGSRPVLVVSSDAINRLPLVVTIVVGTDAANISRDYPVNVRVTAAEPGLPRDTVFLCFQVRSGDWQVYWIIKMRHGRRGQSSSNGRASVSGVEKV